MTMKHFIGADGHLYAYSTDGSQDHVIPDTHTPIAEDEAKNIAEIKQQAEFEANDYYRKRLYTYPEIGEFLDAWVKNDKKALEEYRQKCLDVKAKYPKPAGF